MERRKGKRRRRKEGVGEREREDGVYRKEGGKGEDGKKG